MDRARLKEAVGEDRVVALKRMYAWGRRSYLVVVALGLVVGLLVAPVTSDLVTTPVSGQVAVIPLQGSIDGSNAASTVARLEEARQNPRVKAVVLQVNSGGGGATAGEEIYLAVRETADEMPVVVSVDAMGASAAYFAAAPADEILVKPATLIGSVGTIFIAPTPIDPVSGVVITGPNKLTGADLREWQHKVESVQNAFVEAVYYHRGDRLELTREELAYGKLYSGPEAVRNGVADRIGGLQDAVDRAATLAGLTTYGVEVIGYTGPVSFVTRAAYVAADVDDKELISPSVFIAPPSETAAPTIMMLPPSVVRAALADHRTVGSTEVNRVNGSAA